MKTAKLTVIFIAFLALTNVSLAQRPYKIMRYKATWSVDGSYKNPGSIFVFNCANNATGVCSLWGYDPNLDDCQANGNGGWYLIPFIASKYE